MDLDRDLPLELERAQAHARRTFLKRSQTGLGAIALGLLLNRDRTFAKGGRDGSPGLPVPSDDHPLLPRPPHFAPKAKRVIYLHMSGGPPQQDLFDYKPELVKHHLQPCPDRLLKNQKFAFIKGHPKLLGTPYKFEKCGQSGSVLSELWTNLRTVVERPGNHQIDEYRSV